MHNLLLLTHNCSDKETTTMEYAAEALKQFCIALVKFKEEASATSLDEQFN